MGSFYATALITGATIGIAACGSASDQPVRRTVAACTGGSDDSSAAVSVAIDTLSKLDSFRSEVLRYAHDSTGFRIVTIPAAGQHLVDGMAIVVLDSQCRIVSLVQTDSA